MRTALSSMAILFLAALFGSGCATNKVDWNSRIGTYTYDQALIDLGPPDKTAELTDGSKVVEWVTSQNYTVWGPPIGGYVPYGPYGYHHPRYYPGYYGGSSTVRQDSYFLRLIFGPDGRLQSWRRFVR